MILTCPECATSYFVDDARIPPEGRRVKCTSCGARWTARLEGAAPSEPDPLFEEPPETPAAEAAPSEREPDAEPAPEPEPEPVAEAAPPADDLEVAGPDPAYLRRKALAAAKAAPAKKEAAGAAMLWAGIAAIVAVVVAGAILFREDVVKLWPKSSAAYATLGLPAGGAGLVIEGVHAEPTFIGGRPALSVTGAIRNIRDQTTETPPIRISLLDRRGKPVAAKIARPLDGRIPARAKRHFALAIVDPPAEARDLEVTFDAADAKSAQAAPLPTPAEAQPAPAGPQDPPPTHG